MKTSSFVIPTALLSTVLLACASGDAAGKPATVPSSGGTVAVGASPAAATQSLAVGAGAAPGGALTGTIASVSDGYISLNTTRGPLRLAVDAGTRITRTEQIRANDLAPGENIVVAGTRGPDGVLTASSVTASDSARDIVTRGPGETGGGLTGPGGFRGPAGQGFLTVTPGTGAFPDGGRAGAGAAPGAFQRGQGGPGFAGQGTPADPAQIEAFIQQGVESGRLTPEQAAAARAGIQSGGLPDRQGQVRNAARVNGIVKSVEGAVINVSTTEGEVAVASNADTTFQKVSTLAMSDLQVGVAVSINAERGDDGVVRAVAVFIGQAPGSIFRSP